ncbi:MULTISPECIES: hypothetical protein [Halomonas]|uniref:hypothetical protein n=1 Tax=Halomonas TaxID=2745 RepID=UPI003CE8E929
MAIINIGKHQITYPTAADMGLSPNEYIEPVIISQSRTMHAVTNIRLSFEEVVPTLVVEHFNKRSQKTGYADLSQETLDVLFETAHKRHVVGIMQTHLASELYRLIKSEAFHVSAPIQDAYRKSA